MCRLMVDLSMLCQASLNSRACIVVACLVSLFVTGRKSVHSFLGRICGRVV